LPSSSAALDFAAEPPAALSLALPEHVSPSYSLLPQPDESRLESEAPLQLSEDVVSPGLESPLHESLCAASLPVESPLQESSAPVVTVQLPSLE
jgi:hypothetical protein